MGINKTYDEMADRYEYRGYGHQMLDSKSAFGEVQLSVAFVDLKEGGDTFWIIARRKGSYWHWIDDASFILLVDGERFSGVGTAHDGQVTEEPGFFDTKIWCNEEIHCGGDIEIMNLIADSKSSKFRLGGVDFVLPQGLISDVKEIVADINATGGYGDN